MINYATRRHDEPWEGYADEDGKETVQDWRCEEGCPVAEIGNQSGNRPSTMAWRLPSSAVVKNPGYTDKSGYGGGLFGGVSNVYADSGGTSRFFKHLQNHKPPYDR